MWARWSRRASGAGGRACGGLLLGARRLASSSSSTSSLRFPGLPRYWGEPELRLDGSEWSYVESASLRTLRHPSEFYEALLDGARTATRQVSLASLYLGTGPQEQALVSALASRGREVPTLQTRVVLDGARGRRGATNSVTMLAPLATALGASRFSLSLFRLPHHDWRVASHLPLSMVEGYGVMHAKLYAFDDRLILSGANLSQDYFTNRADRYLVIDDPALASAAHQAVAHLAAASEARSFHPLHASFRTCGAEAAKSSASSSTEAAPLGTAANTTATSTSATATTTAFLPRWQCRPWGVVDDEIATQTLLASLGAGDVVHLATGYFNLPGPLQTAVLAAAQRGARIHILTAAPEANGFHRARGITGAVASAYTRILADFIDHARSAGVYSTGEAEAAAARAARPQAPSWLPTTAASSSSSFLASSAKSSAEPSADSSASTASGGFVRVYEWRVPGQTFHGKGLWVDRGSSEPLDVLVGSPNFGRRTWERDLDLQFHLRVPATAQATVASFRAERDALFASSCATVVDAPMLRNHPERRLHAIFDWHQGYWIDIGRFVLAPFF